MTPLDFSVVTRLAHIAWLEANGYGPRVLDEEADADAQTWIARCPSCSEAEDDDATLTIYPPDWIYPARCSRCQLGEPLLTPDAIRLEWASEVTPERIEWLWTDRLPLHDLAVLAGEPGLGKSTTTTELAARITRGDLEGALYGQPRSVLIASAEDHFASVIWGRLKAAGADLSRVASVTTADGELSIPSDAENIARACRKLRTDGHPVALIVVDPISAYLGGVDSHKDAAVRGALAPLATLAQTEGVCVLVVAHLNKSNAGKLLDRISGSGAFGAAPRSVLAFARDPDDPDGEQGSRRVIVHAKSNHGQYAPTLAAHIDAPMVLEVGATVSRLVIDGETDVSPEDLRPDLGRDQSSSDDIQEAILAALAAGERPSREVKAEVVGETEAGKRSIERAASALRDLGEMAIDQRGMPRRTFWRLTDRTPLPVAPLKSRHAGVTGHGATGNPQHMSRIDDSESPSRATSDELARLNEPEPVADDPDPSDLDWTDGAEEEL